MSPGSFQVTWLQRRDLKIAHFAPSPRTSRGRVASNSGGFIDDNQQLELHRLPLEGNAGHRNGLSKISQGGPFWTNCSLQGVSRAPSLKHVSVIQI